ncbi:MAG TPA: RsmE family RNA methyltransferase [Leptolinea sp.]
MSGHRFFLPPEIFNLPEIVFPATITRQINSVLRLKRGQAVTILDNLGNCRPVVLDEVENHHVTGTAGDIQNAPGEPIIKLMLYPALTQREKFEWILQKGCELGVSEFHPLLTSRTLAQEIHGWEEKQSRWQKILQEASEQCGRGLIPKILLPHRFELAVNELRTTPGFILHEKEQNIGLTTTLSTLLSSGEKSLAILVGPEGGFSEEEVEMAEDAGLQTVSLGARVLRMETAAVAACAICMAAAGELGDLTVSK